MQADSDSRPSSGQGASDPARPAAPVASDALLRATRAADPDALARLLAQGADPDSRSPAGEPLIRVAQLAGQWANVQRLVEHGADIDAHPPGQPGDTVLAFYSAGQFDKVHWLLEHGADPGHRIEAAAEPSRVGARPIVENIYWWPVQAGQYPSLAQWQRRSQDLLARQGHSAPPQPAHLRKLQQAQQGAGGGTGAETQRLEQSIDDAEGQVRGRLREPGSR